MFSRFRKVDVGSLGFISFTDCQKTSTDSKDYGQPPAAATR